MSRYNQWMKSKERCMNLVERYGFVWQKDLLRLLSQFCNENNFSGSISDSYLFVFNNYESFVKYIQKNKLCKVQNK
jgi:hypothetical protein